MTIIAYKDGIMAADTQISFGGCTVRAGNKILKIGNWVIGLSGAAVFSKHVLDTFSGHEPAFFAPSIPKTDRMGDEDGVWALAVNREYPNVIWRYDRFGDPYIIEGPYMASGAGMDVALGAMFVGASAEDAVRAAIAHCQSCGGDIQVVKVA